MKNYVLGYNDIGYEANVTGGIWQNDLDTRMLGRKLLTAVAKTTDLTPLVLDITLNQSIDIQTLGICNHNFSPTGTYQWQAFSDPDRLTEVYNSGVIVAGTYYAKIIHKTTCDTIDTPVATAYWRLSINDLSNTDGFTKIGRLFMGLRFDPDCNMDYGMSHTIDTSNTIEDESSIGIEAFIQSVRQRGVVLHHRTLASEMAQEYYRMQMQLGVSENVLYEFDPDNKYEGIYTFIGRNLSINPLNYPAFNINNIGFVLREIL